MIKFHSIVLTLALLSACPAEQPRTDAGVATDAGNPPIEECVAGSFDQDPGPGRDCVPCAEACGVDSFETQACGNGSDRTCAACSAPCEAGSFETQACGNGLDRTCNDCSPSTFDHDGDPLTACSDCLVCPHGSVEVSTCESLQDRSCSECPEGTTDADADPLTACTQCSTCTNALMPFGSCTATTDVLCHACTDATHAPLATINPLAENPFADCVAGDPLCLESIDVLLFYDHTALAHFGGNVDALHGWVQNALRFANEVNDNSLFSPQRRYRLAGLRPFDRSPRQDSISTMVQLRFNQYYQSIRRSTGADVSFFLIGNLTFGNGQTYYMFSGLDYSERAVIVLKSGFTAHPSQCGSNRNRTITAHELGHINGASHNRAIGGGNGTGYGFAYHNQEPFYRRNEAFGLEVSQHGEQFYTVMSYPSYRSGPEYDSRASCPPPCKRIAAFASPELWRFLNPRDPLYGYCLVVQTNNDQTVRLSCQTRQPWSEIDGSYVLDPAQMVDLPAQELLNRAVPLGRDTPSFVHPETQEMIIDTTSTRSRDKVIETWPRRASAAKPLDPRCNQQCDQVNRITCGAGENVCGSCLPGYFEFSGTCYARVETHAQSPLHDEHYIPSGVFAAPNAIHSSIIELAAPSDLIAVEVYLHTTNAEGAFDDGWAQGPENGVNFTFGVPAAPAHRISVWGVNPDNSETLIGNQSTDGVVARDSNGQHDHALTYLFHLSAWRENLVRIRVEVVSETPDYGFGINEIRSFGRQR